MDNCTVCPRNCAADRIHTYGYCKAPLDAVVHAKMVHMGEEPVISGSRGSGTIFFAGCNWAAFFAKTMK